LLFERRYPTPSEWAKSVLFVSFGRQGCCEFANIKLSCLTTVKVTLISTYELPDESVLLRTSIIYSVESRKKLIGTNNALPKLLICAIHWRMLIQMAHRKFQNMKLQHKLILLAASLLVFPACDQQPNANKKDGIKDAFDTRPNEEMRDLGEGAEKAAKDVGRDLKNAVNPK